MCPSVHLSNCTFIFVCRLKLDISRSQSSFVPFLTTLLASDKSHNREVRLGKKEKVHMRTDEHASENLIYILLSSFWFFLSVPISSLSTLINRHHPVNDAKEEERFVRVKFHSHWILQTCIRVIMVLHFLKWFMRTRDSLRTSQLTQLDESWWGGKETRE